MISPVRWQVGQTTPLYGTQATRRIEAWAQSTVPAHTLMQRAGLSVFRLGRALYPHAREVWVACGGGNNGGDGLVAALAWHQHLAASGGRVSVGWLGQAAHPPADARWAWDALQRAGVPLSASPSARTDLVVDALLGLGVDRPLQGAWAAYSHCLQTTTAPVLCVDVPSGLDADSGHWWSPAPLTPRGPRHTLSLLTLKPGLFTGMGRAVCGQLWWDDLGTGLASCAPLACPSALPSPSAHLHAPNRQTPPLRLRHADHKGLRGVVWVVGGQAPGPGQTGMVGAAVLAARAALHSGAGRVFISITGNPAGHIGSTTPSWDPVQPELMWRTADDLPALCAHSDTVTVAGCGGGSTIEAHLPDLLQHANALVLDADGLNAVAHNPTLMAALQARAQRKACTVLTPHPLEAARLLHTDTATVQRDRLGQAQALARHTGALVVLKGSGTVVAHPAGECRINPTGNALLASAGTGDVLAGMVAARLAGLAQHHDAEQAFAAVCDAVYHHGLAADHWPACDGLTASDLYTQRP